jgi:hypothetical protein
MPLTSSRYDGLADWYDSWNEPNAARNAAEVIDLLGPGDGLCLDLARPPCHLATPRSPPWSRCGLYGRRRLHCCTRRSGPGPGPRRGAGFLRRSSVLQRAAHAMDGRRRDSRPPDLSAVRMASGGPLVGLQHPQTVRHAPPLAGGTAQCLHRERLDDRARSRAGRAAGPDHPRPAGPQAAGRSRCVYSRNHASSPRAAITCSRAATWRYGSVRPARSSNRRMASSDALSGSSASGHPARSGSGSRTRRTPGRRCPSRPAARGASPGRRRCGPAGTPARPGPRPAR